MLIVCRSQGQGQIVFAQKPLAEGSFGTGIVGWGEFGGFGTGVADIGSGKAVVAAVDIDSATVAIDTIVAVGVDTIAADCNNIAVAAAVVATVPNYSVYKSDYLDSHKFLSKVVL